MNSIIKKLLIVAFVGSLYYFAIYIKNKYGITFNESAINDFQIWIKNLGIYAPLVFILLVKSIISFLFDSLINFTLFC